MDLKLTGYLRRALNHEMAAVQQYLTQSVLCELWGMQDMANNFRAESSEELEHARRIISRMLTMGLLPNNTQLPSIRVTRSLRDMWMAAWHIEAEAVQLYAEASQYCMRIGDECSYHLFHGLMQEERQHLQEVEQALNALGEQGTRNE